MDKSVDSFADFERARRQSTESPSLGKKSPVRSFSGEHKEKTNARRHEDTIRRPGEDNNIQKNEDTASPTMSPTRSIEADQRAAALRFKIKKTLRPRNKESKIFINKNIQ